MRDPPLRSRFDFAAINALHLSIFCYGQVFYPYAPTVIPDAQPLEGDYFFGGLTKHIWFTRIRLRGVVGKWVQNASNHIV
jgi:hypothetical protein